MTGTTLCIKYCYNVYCNFNNRFPIDNKNMNTIVSNSYQQVLIWETSFLVIYSMLSVCSKYAIILISVCCIKVSPEDWYGPDCVNILSHIR